MCHFALWGFDINNQPAAVNTNVKKCEPVGGNYFGSQENPACERRLTNLSANQTGLIPVGQSLTMPGQSA